MLWKYSKRYPWLVITALLLVTIQVGATLYQPEVTKNIIAELSGNNDRSVINYWGMILVGVGAVGLLVGVINTVISAKLSLMVATDIRKDGFKSIQKLAFADIEEFSTGNLVVMLTNDVTQVQNLIMLGLQMILRVPLLFIGAFILAVISLPALWWTIILYVILVIVITTLIMTAAGPQFGFIQKIKGKMNNTIKENLDGVRVVKSFGTEKKETAKYEKENKQMTDSYWKIGKFFASMIPSFMLIANIVIGVAIIYVGNQTNTELIGSVVSYMSYVMQLMFSILMAGFLGMTVGMGAASIKRLNEILTAKPSITYGDAEMGEFQTLEFKNVSFKYDKEEENTINDVSFKVNHGEKIGIVGSTGSGKTTLVQLIPKLYKINSGEILINGENIDVLSSKTLTDNISIVLQKAQLFSGTINDTILQGDTSASSLDVEMAAKRAQAYEFITKKEGEFEGEVYQKGANFSGGQKQRLSIARGLVKDPQILILDDSTSALDAKSENLVKEAIENELTDVTTLIVSQKISSIVNTDKIIVLDEGKIDSIGTHKELLEKSEIYREIYDTQKGKEV